MKNFSNLSKNDTNLAEYCQFAGRGKIDGYNNQLKIKEKNNLAAGLKLGMVLACL